MPEIAQYSVRDGDTSITISGQLLSHVSSKRDNVKRWSELSLYALPKGYLVEKVGRSTVEGEIDRYSIITQATIAQVVSQLCYKYQPPATIILRLLADAEEALTSVRTD